MSTLITANVAFNSEATYRLESGGGTDNVIRIVGQSNGTTNTIHIGEGSRIVVNGMVNIVNTLIVTSNLYTNGKLTSNSVTFTPRLLFGGGNTSMTVSAASGDAVITPFKVSFTVRMTLTNKGTSTGSAIIQLVGLPQCAGVSGAGGADFSSPARCGFWSGFSANSAQIGAVIQTTATPNLDMRIHGTAAATSTLTHVNFTNTSDIILDGFYYTTG